MEEWQKKEKKTKYYTETKDLTIPILLKTWYESGWTTSDTRRTVVKQPSSGMEIALTIHIRS